MILKSASKEVKEYGFPEVMEYDNPSFHGTQKGVCVCIKDNETGAIINNSMPVPDVKKGDEDSIEKIRSNELQKLLNDNRILLIENNITQMEDGELKSRTIYYLPYYVVDHSFLKPTVLFDNVSDTYNESYDISVEVLFVEDNLNRYVTFDFKTCNVSVMDLVYGLFEETEIHGELSEAGFLYRKESEEFKEGFYLDFYDEAGNKYDLCFSRIDRFRDAIVSMRLIDIKRNIKGVSENGN